MRISEIERFWWIMGIVFCELGIPLQLHKIWESTCRGDETVAEFMNVSVNVNFRRIAFLTKIFSEPFIVHSSGEI